MVRAWPRVRECHMLMGETDFLLKIVAHDWAILVLSDQLAHPCAQCQPCEDGAVHPLGKGALGVPIDGVD